MAGRFLFEALFIDAGNANVDLLAPSSKLVALLLSLSKLVEKPTLPP